MGGKAQSSRSSTVRHKWFNQHLLDHFICLDLKREMPGASILALIEWQKGEQKEKQN
jgi:hypothetical protein